MSLRVFDRIWGILFIILGITTLGVVLVNVAGLSTYVSMSGAFAGLLSIVFGFFCFSVE